MKGFDEKGELPKEPFWPPFWHQGMDIRGRDVAAEEHLEGLEAIVLTSRPPFGPLLEGIQREGNGLAAS